MSARDDYLATIDMGGDYVELRRSQYEQAMDEIDRLREDAALGREIQWEIGKWGDPYLMGVRARVRAGDGFTQNGEEAP